MPEEIKKSSRELLKGIIQRTLDIQEDTGASYEDLLNQIDKADTSREFNLEKADQRLIRLLNTSANTQFL